MNAITTQSPKLELKPLELHENKGVRFVNIFFRTLYAVILACALGYCLYWLFSSDRYVSEATVVIQSTEQPPVAGGDYSLLLMRFGGGLSNSDIFILREHLLSIDMLKKLDNALDLRSHYSDSSRDPASRMWFKDASMEWFHRHYLGRVSVEFDDYAGVLRIRTEAYTAKMATDITAMLVREGENFINELSHQIARTQVNFLDSQVKKARDEVEATRNELLQFQNQKGLVSPKTTVESIHGIIAKLEEQRTSLQTRLASLPAKLDKNHPTRKSLNQSLRAIEKQIAQESRKLAAPGRQALNALAGEQTRLEQELSYKEDIYKAALLGLEKGRMDAARMLKRVSVLQAPTVPEYAWEPRRMYGLGMTLFLTFMALGIAALIRSVVLDHVD